MDSQESPAALWALVILKYGAALIGLVLLILAVGSLGPDPGRPAPRSRTTVGDRAVPAPDLPVILGGTLVALMLAGMVLAGLDLEQGRPPSAAGMFVVAGIPARRGRARDRPSPPARRRAPRAPRGHDGGARIRGVLHRDRRRDPRDASQLLDPALDRVPHHGLRARARRSSGRAGPPPPGSSPSSPRSWRRSPRRVSSAACSIPPSARAWRCRPAALVVGRRDLRAVRPDAPAPAVLAAAVRPGHGARPGSSSAPTRWRRDGRARAVERLDAAAPAPPGHGVSAEPARLRASVARGWPKARSSRAT